MPCSRRACSSSSCRCPGAGPRARALRLLVERDAAHALHLLAALRRRRAGDRRLRASARRWRWALLVGASLLLAYLGGLSGELVLKLTGGLFRYPQKLLLWTTVGAALLAGWGFDRLAAVGRRPGAGSARADHPRAVRRLAASAPRLPAGVAVLLLACAVPCARVLRGAARCAPRLDRGDAADAVVPGFRGGGAARSPAPPGPCDGAAASRWWRSRRWRSCSSRRWSPRDRVDALPPPAPWIAQLGERAVRGAGLEHLPAVGTEVPMRGVESDRRGLARCASRTSIRRPARCTA